MKWSGVVVNMTSVKDNSTIKALTDSEGSYQIEVVPDVPYILTGASSLENKYPIPTFHYRNTDIYFGPGDQLIVKPNNTIFIDYEIRLP